jgi:hypothetical protein
MPATLDAARVAIQSGEAYKTPPGVSDLSDIGSAMGSKGTGAVATASLVEGAWDTSTKNLSTTFSVTSTQVKVIEQEAKAQGREATEEELEEACGPLSFLTKIPNLLGDAISSIYGKFNEFFSAFGEAVGDFMKKFDQLVADVANAVDEVAKSIAEAALAAFEFVNQAALAAVDAIASTINTVAGAINDAIQFATNAFNAAVDKLLAWADSLNFGSLFSLNCQKEALEEGVDTEKIADSAEVSRVVSPTEKGRTLEPTDRPKDQVAPESVKQPQTAFASPTSSTPDLEAAKKKYLKAAAEADEASRALFRQSAYQNANQVNSRYESAVAARDAAEEDMKAKAKELGVPESSLPVYKSSSRTF